MQNPSAESKASGDLLIGHSGYVGTTLKRQRTFDMMVRSIDAMRAHGGRFGLVIAAAAPAQKWIANRDPGADRTNIEKLLDTLRKLQCEQFVLISTVDVFRDPVGVDEHSVIDEDGLHAYGRHRRMLEREVEALFPRHLIVRLPGLVGPGLRKNAIYDLANDNNLNAVDSRGVFQFYPMVNLWCDISKALDASLSVVHLTAEPLSIAEIALEGFGRYFDNHVVAQPARYDLRTVNAALFGGDGGYQYSRRETMLAIRAYAQSGPRAILDPTSEV